MNLFNRIMTTFVLLALIPIITVALIAPEEAVQLMSDVFDRIDSRVDFSFSTAEMIVRVAVAVILNALLVVLIYLEIRSPSVFGVPVQLVQGGDAELAVSSIVEQLEYHIDPLPGVLDVKPDVVPRRRKVEVALEIRMAADSSLPANIEEISAIARRVIEQDLGLELKGKPRLKLVTVPAPQPTPLTAIGAFESRAPDESSIEAEVSDRDDAAYIVVQEDATVGPDTSVVDDTGTEKDAALEAVTLVEDDAGVEEDTTAEADTAVHGDTGVEQNVAFEDSGTVTLAPSGEEDDETPPQEPNEPIATEPTG